MLAALADEQEGMVDGFLEEGQVADAENVAVDKPVDMQPTTGVMDEDVELEELGDSSDAISREVAAMSGGKPKMMEALELEDNDESDEEVVFSEG